MLDEEVQTLLDLYPRIFFACHERHAKQPEARKRLSAQQSDIIDHLDHRRASTLKRLAEHMGVTPSTMSTNVNRLVRLGYVSREVAPHSRREVAIRLTPEGRKVKESDQVLEPGRVRRLLTSLSETERRKALDGLAILAGAADASRHKAEAVK